MICASLLWLGMIMLGMAVLPVAAAQGEAPEFPNVPDVPVPPGVGYDGFFQKHQPVKIVFGVSDPGDQMRESLTNAAYTIKYLEPRGIPYEIQVVLYGRAVLPASQFATERAGYAPLMKALSEYGVSFKVCNNSLAALDPVRGRALPLYGPDSRRDPSADQEADAGLRLHPQCRGPGAP